MKKLLALVLAMTFAACGGDDGGGNPDSRPRADAPGGADARVDADTTPDADTSMTSAQIQAAIDAPDGAADLDIDNATVTYLKPQIGNDPAGFTIQAAMAGPALFIAVDPATLTPAPAVGMTASFTITNMATAGMLRQADMIADFTSGGGGADIDSLVQDISSATDVTSAIGSYASELVDVAGTIPVAEAFTFAGTGFQQVTIETAGISGDATLKLRVPTAEVKDAIDLVPGCSFTLDNVPMGRFNANAQLPAYRSGDITLSGCPAPTLASAAAPSATSVVLTFSRNIAPSSVMGDGSQFTLTGGLTASAASVNGRTVTVTTSAQTGGNTYTVTVVSGVTDLQGTPLMVPVAAMFTGFGAVDNSRLVINEVDYDQISSDTTEFIEVFNAGTGPANLANYAVVLVNGSNSAEYLRFNLADAGASLPAGSYLVIKNAAVTVPGGVLTLATADSTVQNGAPDGIAIIDTSDSSVVDALSYEGAITAAVITGLPGPVSLVEGTATPLVDDGTTVSSMARTPNGADTDDAATDWALATPSPGASN